MLLFLKLPKPSRLECMSNALARAKQWIAGPRARC